MYTPAFQGVHLKGGLVIDLSNEQDGLESFSEMSESEAAACMVKCRNVMSTTYFSKGILQDLGYYIKE